MTTISTTGLLQSALSAIFSPATSKTGGGSATSGDSTATGYATLGAGSLAALLAGTAKTTADHKIRGPITSASGDSSSAAANESSSGSSMPFDIISISISTNAAQTAGTGAYGPGGSLSGAGTQSTNAQSTGAQSTGTQGTASGYTIKTLIDQKTFASMQISNLKDATRNAEILSVLDPKGALEYARWAARQLTEAVKSFGSGEKGIEDIEDQNAASQTASQTGESLDVTIIAGRIVTDDPTGADDSADGAADDGGSEEADAAGADAAALSAGPVSAGPASSGTAAASSASSSAPDPDVDGSTDAVGGTDGTEGGSSYELDLTVFQLQVGGGTDADGSAATAADATSAAVALPAATLAARNARLAADAPVIGDAISTLRHLGYMIAKAAKALELKGEMDARTKKELTKARDEFGEAVDATEEAAEPILEAGYSVLPTDNS